MATYSSILVWEIPSPYMVYIHIKFVMRTYKIYSLSNFQMYSIILTVITMLYIALTQTHTHTHTHTHTLTDRSQHFIVVTSWLFIMLSIFSCTCWLSVFFLWKIVHIKKNDNFIFCCWVEGILYTYIFGYWPFITCMICSIFIPFSK